MFTKDEGPRADTSLEALAKLKPVFQSDGTVTAGNSSQTSDGAAAAIVMSDKKAEELGLKPMARFVSFAVAGVPPEIMGIGPVVAIPKALALAGLKTEDIGVIELNEAFAVQALAVIRKAGLDLDRVNPNGGAIALGHPLGCTGAKLTATILREMHRKDTRYGMVTMCVGGGQGAAGIFENLIRNQFRWHPRQSLPRRIRAARSSSSPRRPSSSSRPKTSPTNIRAIARTTEEFWTKEIAPNVDAIQHQEPGVAVSVLRKAGELGLTSVHLPEKYGGMEMDLTSAMLVAEGIAKDGSYAAWHGGQSGIGALPLLLFGTEEQKQRYLPEARDRGTGRRLRAERAAGRIGCLGRAHARRLEPGRQALHPQRPENVDHQRRRGRSVHHLRESRWREIHRISGRAQVSRAFRPAPKKRRWASRAAPPRPSISTTCRCRWKTFWAKSAAAISSRSTS